MELFNIKRQILNDLRVELTEEFDNNFERRAFFDQPWPERRYPITRGSLMQVTGRGRRSIRGQTLSNGVRWSSDSAYMGLHNKGGKVRITPKMRKYFWAMYYKATGGMTYSIKKKTANNTAKNRRLSDTAQYWKGMALTRKNELTMPKRQFIGEHPRVRAIVRKVIDDNMQRAFRELAQALKPR